MSTASTGDKSFGLPDVVTRRLNRAITTGALPPGARLSPARLAEDLGVSHIPVREALAALGAAGQVTRIPGVGCFVTELSTQDIEDVFHWRRVLEDEAHRLSVPRLGEADLACMREHDAGMRTGDLTAFLECQRALHFVPFRRVGSEYLVRFLTHLWDVAARFQTSPGYERVPTLLAEHQEPLLAAFEARDVAAVNAIMATQRELTLDAVRG
jgi:DNA-binding GntR family transcriptional regulator